MSAAIPGTDLDIVVRRIREIGQRMYEEGEITNAPRRHRPVSRWELSGRAPPHTTPAGYRGITISICPPVALFVAAAGCNSGPTICFWSGHVTGPGEPGIVKSSAPGQNRQPEKQEDPLLAIPVARVVPSPAIARPSMATGRTPPPRPPPPITASAAVQPVLTILQALPSLLSHSPYSPGGWNCGTSRRASPQHHQCKALLARSTNRRSRRGERPWTRRFSGIAWCV